MATLFAEQATFWPLESEGVSAGDSAACTTRFRVRGNGLYPLIKDGDLVLAQATRHGDLVAGSLVLREGHGGMYTSEVFLEGTFLHRVGFRSHLQGSPAGEPEGRVGRVVAIERAGRRRQRDGRRARVLNRLYFGLWPLTRPLIAAKKLLSLFDPRYRVAHPRVSLASVAAKYEDPEEVSYCEGIVKEGLSSEEQRLVEHHMVPAGRLLDVGCGAGREAFAFASLGYEVLAIDVAPTMIEAATRSALADASQVEFQARNVTDLDDRVGEFDYVFFSEGVYSLIPTRQLRIESLSRAAALLAPGGRIFVSALLRRTTYASRIALQGAILGLSKKLIGRPELFEPGDRMSRSVSPVGDPSKLCYTHLFESASEVDEEVRAAGLEGSLDRVSGYWVLALPATGQLP